MNKFFNINYEMDKTQVYKSIEEVINLKRKGYICVADGVVMNTANRNKDYLNVVNGGLFAICDSGWVPLYLKSIYGIRYEQLCGADIFKEVVSSRKYRMIFMGSSQSTLDALQKELEITMNPDVKNMRFVELPFKKVEDFDYPAIAKMIEEDSAQIIWVALGAPKQEWFMNKLLPYLKSGVMLGVGAVFKFYSGKDEPRCPKWIHKCHLEFLYRIYQDPKKQLRRCFWILVTLPKLYIDELKRKKKIENHLKIAY